MVDGLARALKDALLVLFAVALVVMALTLLVVFRSRLRLLPLALALAAAAIVFGLLGLFGGSLTMASIAVLPILIGLAVDYAIQFQARFDEAIEDGGHRRQRSAGRHRRRPDDRHRLPRHRRRLPRPPALPDPDGPQLRPAPRRRRRYRLRLALKGGNYVVKGALVVVDGIEGALKDALLVLFAVAVVVMARDPASRLPLAPAPAARWRSPSPPPRSSSASWASSAAP